MKIFYLEDHAFYANSIIPRLKKKGHEVVHCLNYKSAEEEIAKGNFDCALLDVVLTNGKTGIHFAEKYSNKFNNKMLFITGCRDLQTIETLINKNWNSVSKQYEIWDDLVEFLDHNKEVHISIDEAC